MTEMSTATTMRTKTNPCGLPTFHQPAGALHSCVEDADLKRLACGAPVVFPVHARHAQAALVYLIESTTNCSQWQLAPRR